MKKFINTYGYYISVIFMIIPLIFINFTTNDSLKSILSVIFMLALSLLIYISVINKKEKKQLKESKEIEKADKLFNDKNIQYETMKESKIDISKNTESINGYKTKRTFLKGIKFYQSSQYVENGEEVLIVHNMTNEFPENIDVYYGINKIGTIMKEFAFDLHREFGDNFLIKGEIVKLDKEKDEFDIEEITAIQIEFEIPIYKS